MALWATVYEFKNEYKDIASASDDDFISRAMSAAALAIEGPGQGINRVVLAASDTTEYFDVDGWEVEGNSLWVSYRGDLSSITTVTNGDGNTVSSSNYNLYPKTLSAARPSYDRIHLTTASNLYWTAGTNDPENAISVAGKWGMYSTAATVPDNLKLAQMMLAAFALEQRKSQVFDTIAVPDAGIIQIPAGWPAAVKALIAGYRRIPLAASYV